MGLVGLAPVDAAYSQSPFNAVNDGDPAFVRGLKVTLDRMGKTDWAEVSSEFQIENVLR